MEQRSGLERFEVDNSYRCSRARAHQPGAPQHGQLLMPTRCSCDMVTSLSEDEILNFGMQRDETREGENCDEA